MNKVSIVIPVLNRQHSLPVTLHSVSSQTYNDWEVVIIDDGSEDGSLEIAKDFLNKHPGKCQFLHSLIKKSGAAACRNMGLKAATGKYIIFLDSDDMLAPFCLEQRVATLLGNPSIDWAVFMQYEWTANEPNTHKVFSKSIGTKEQAIKLFLQMDPPWQTMSPIWQKHAINSLGGFDETLLFMEDPDLHLRALLSNLNVSFKTDLPADCFYRVNLLQNSTNVFYNKSIQYRFQFLSKVLVYLTTLKKSGSYLAYKKSLKKGFYKFCKVFLCARMSEYQTQFTTLTNALYRVKILNFVDVIKLTLTKKIFTTNSIILTRMRLRGVWYKLLFN